MEEIKLSKLFSKLGGERGVRGHARGIYVFCNSKKDCETPVRSQRKPCSCRHPWGKLADLFYGSRCVHCKEVDTAECGKTDILCQLLLAFSTFI